VNDLSLHNLTFEDAIEMALDMPNNDDDDALL